MFQYYSILSQGTFDRLAQQEAGSAVNSQLQYFLAAFEEEEDSIKEWYSRFRNLKVV